LAVALGAVLFVTGPRAHADQIHWSISATTNTPVLVADGARSGGVAFTHQQTQYLAGTGSHSIIASTLIAFSSADSGHPDRFINKLWRLTLMLQDGGSHKTGQLVFTGLLNGTFTGSDTHITNTFTGPRKQRLHLGHYYYDVTIGPFIPPTALGTGEIAAQVTVTHNPEPSSVVLGVLGTLGLGLFGWRRYARQRHLAAAAL
jgi:hypothetical protein